MTILCCSLPSFYVFTSQSRGAFPRWYTNLYSSSLNQNLNASAASQHDLAEPDSESIINEYFFLYGMQDILNNNNDVDIQENIVFQKCLLYLSPLSQLPIAYSTSVNDCNGFEIVLCLLNVKEENKKDFQS